MPLAEEVLSAFRTMRAKSGGEKVLSRQLRISQVSAAFGLRDSGFVFRVSGFVFRDSGFVSCFVFRDSGFVFRVSGLVLRDSCFVFRVLEFVFSFLVFGVWG